VAEQLQAAIWITAACVRVAEGCFELAGSRAVYESSSLQRRVRDLRVAAQHVTVHPRHYVTAGAAMLARLAVQEPFATTHRADQRWEMKNGSQDRI
jgi:alkylation response protein AidB-like acyl-CoA dehydrogenase